MDLVVGVVGSNYLQVGEVEVEVEVTPVEEVESISVVVGEYLIMSEEIKKVTCQAGNLLAMVWYILSIWGIIEQNASIS